MFIFNYKNILSNFIFLTFQYTISFNLKFFLKKIIN